MYTTTLDSERSYDNHTDPNLVVYIYLHDKVKLLVTEWTDT